MAARHAPKSGPKPDWVVLALPTVLASHIFSVNGSLVLLSLLFGVALLRKPEGKFSVQIGPFLLLAIAFAIVFSRSEGHFLTAASLLILMLSLRLSMTIDARRLIASLIDGCGIYLAANLIFNAFGIRTKSSAEWLSGLKESTGFIRTVFPLSGSINSPSIVAAVYLVGTIYLLSEAGRLRRVLRIIGAASAIMVIIGAGSRNALAVTIVLSCIALFLPFASRWIGQASLLLSAISAFTLPRVMSYFQFLIVPLISLNPGRETTDAGAVSLQGRAQIWDGSIKYWNERITDTPDILLGFGEGGQYRSGASLTYISIVRGLSATPERTHVHNSFLQQMFDGGVLGWLFMASALFWASVRLSNRRRDWGRWGMSAIFALTAVLLCSVTESTSAPGIFQESCWIMVVLVSIACQAKETAGKSPVDRTNAASAP